MEVADLVAGLDGVDLKSIVLNLVFLTIPGLALATGLKRFRTPDETGGGGLKSQVQKASTQLASTVTIVALLMAGLGLVPVVRAVYVLVAGLDEAAPAVVGVVVVAVLLVKGLVMARDLMEAGLRNRWMWLLLVWVAPVVADQITDQAGRTVRMVVDQAKADVQDRNAEPSGKSSKSDRDDESRGDGGD